MNIFNFFRRQPRKIVLIRRISSRLRMMEWRSDADLIKAARKFLTDPEFLVILDVLKNESPANLMLDNRHTIETRAIMQARIEGYEMALSNLEALGMPETRKTEIEPDYSQENIGA